MRGVRCKMKGEDKSVQKEREKKVLATRTISSKGQVVIPAEVRRLLNIEPGDQVIFSLNDFGEIVMRAKKREKLSDLIGILPAKKRVEGDFEVIRKKARRIKAVRKHALREDE